MAKRRGWPGNLLANLRFDPGGCWLFTASGNPGGYGQLYKDGALRYAHRVSYAAFVGPIPDGHQVDHVCHNEDASCAGGPGCPHRRCVRPSHLEAVPQAENIRRGRGGSWGTARTHCPQGHPYDEENTYLYDGRRTCRTCKKAGRKLAAAPSKIVPMAAPRPIP